MRGPILTFLSCCILAAPARAGDMMTPMPDTKVSCNDEYTKAAAAYTPIVGDIMRFDAMFENYAALCGTEKDAKTMKPFVDSMRARADQDVNDSYHVMMRIIKGVLPEHVAQACKDDHGAQEFTVMQFHKMMNDQYDKAKHRLQRSADGMAESQRTQVCRNLSEIKNDFEKHTSGKDLSNPLFEIAFLRGMVLPADPQERSAYGTYRDILKGMQDERAKKPAAKKPMTKKP